MLVQPGQLVAASLRRTTQSLSEVHRVSAVQVTLSWASAIAALSPEDFAAEPLPYVGTEIEGLGAKQWEPAFKLREGGAGAALVAGGSVYVPLGPDPVTCLPPLMMSKNTTSLAKAVLESLEEGSSEWRQFKAGMVMNRPLCFAARLVKTRDPALGTLPASGYATTTPFAVQTSNAGRMRKHSVDIRTTKVRLPPAACT